MPDTITAPVRWSPSHPLPEQSWAKPGVFTAMLRGFRGSCPCCGEGRLFRGWLRQVDVCANCGAPLGAVRADDAPPYVVILVVGHLVIGSQIALDSVMDLSVLAEAAIFLPLTLAACMALLRPAKGATIGLMLQLGLLPARDA